MSEESENMRDALSDASREVQELGGKKAFVSGEWLLKLIRKSFRNYWERATPEYFSQKYGTTDEAVLIKKLTKVASANAAALGAAAGAAVSADQIAALAGIPVSGGLSVPAALAIAGPILMGEALLLVRLQLRLVAQIGKAMGVSLDPDDPEDILTILAYAVGGSVAEAAGKAGAKVGGHVSKSLVRRFIAKDTLKSLQRLGAKLGIKILQRTIIKYVVPAVSIFIGGGWNFLSTRAVAATAQKHFRARRNELPRDDEQDPPVEDARV